jgi:hypothetical protein
VTTHVAFDALISTDLRELQEDAAVAAHVAECARCRSQLDVLLAAEADLRASLAAVAPAAPAAAITTLVLRRAEARRLWMRVILASLTVLLAFLVSPWGRRSQVALGRWAESPPPRVTETYALRCLDPARAASLITSRLESEGSDVRTGSDSVPVIVLTATPAEHVAAGRLLARFDWPGSRLCAAREP